MNLQKHPSFDEEMIDKFLEIKKTKNTCGASTESPENRLSGFRPLKHPYTLGGRAAPLVRRRPLSIDF